MSNSKSTGGNASSENPAKKVQTTQIPTKTTRDDGHRVIVNKPKGGSN